MEETNKENSTNELVPVENEDNPPKVENDKTESLEDARKRCKEWKEKMIPEEDDDEVDTKPTKNVTIEREFEFNVCCMNQVVGDKILLTCEATTWRDIVQKMLVGGLSCYCLGTLLLFCRMENIGQNCVMAASLFILLGDVSYSGGIIYDAIPDFASYGFSFFFAWIGWIVNLATFITWIYLNSRSDPPPTKKRQSQPVQV